MFTFKEELPNEFDLLSPQRRHGDSGGSKFNLCFLEESSDQEESDDGKGEGTAKGQCSFICGVFSLLRIKVISFFKNKKIH